MSESTTIEERLSYLEEQNSGLKRAGLLLVCLVIFMGIVMILQARTASSALSSDGLILNNAGKPRAALTPLPTGHLGLMFFDYAGNLPGAQYNAIPYLDGIAIYDQAGKPRILIGIDDKDNPILAVISPEGKTLFSAVSPAAAPAPANPTGTTTPAPNSSPAPQASPTP